ncbi:hypothetical protein CK203_011574 [Vitis vinifera]|uniref:DUF7054 domain-containing protein n=1 Tax=Vitis vinifera TaxID=29760 RepID=A0A438JUB7_VITVI|nr:hypothetical protein CK203_011574 [Vitis vinifera]
MLLYKQKKNQSAGKANRLLISINVLGSAGPIRFVVSEDELVAAVIDTALKSYAREGRLPILGSDLNNFLLYCSNAGSDALSPWETIAVMALGISCCAKSHSRRIPRKWVLRGELVCPGREVGVGRLGSISRLILRFLPIKSHLIDWMMIIIVQSLIWSSVSSQCNLYAPSMSCVFL